MKKRYIIGPAALVLGIGAALFVPVVMKEEPVEPIDRITFTVDGEKKAVVESLPEETQAEPAPVEEAPQTAPEAPVGQPVEQANPFLAKTPEQQWGELFFLIKAVPVTNERLTRSWSTMTSAAMKYVPTKPELFAPETIKNTAERCVAHFDAIKDPNQLNIELGWLRCGL